jgi:hypothetical protein
MKRIRTIIIVCLLLAAPVLSFSQPLPYQNGNGTVVGGVPVGGPVDGGLGTLLILGLGYGLKKLSIIRNQKKTE